MGKQKLLLPWPSKGYSKFATGEFTVLDSVLSAWTKSHVERTVVVLRRTESDHLQSVCDRYDVDVVLTDNTPDMKSTIQQGLIHIRECYVPNSNDRCFISPADLPSLSSDAINHILDSKFDSKQISVPVFGKKQGHPTLFPWPLTNLIFNLQDKVGVNFILKKHPVNRIHMPYNHLIEDIDTPEEYEVAVQKSFVSK